MSTAGLKPSRESSGVRRSEETSEGRKPEGAMKWEVGARDRQHPGPDRFRNIQRGPVSCSQSKDSTSKI